MSWRDIPVTDLELSVRSGNALKNAGYATLGQLQDLFEKPKSEVMKLLPNFGAKSYREVREVLQQPQQDDRVRVDAWVRTHRDTIRAILDGRAAVVTLWKEH